MKLEELDKNGEHIKVALVGAGLMGKGLVSQIRRVKGMLPSVVVSNNIKDCVTAFHMAGIDDNNITIANTLSEVNLAMEMGNFVATTNWEIAVKANLVDVVVDATGVPNTGAKIAKMSIQNKKHIVMLNVESDIVVGPYLNKMAKEAGVVYTGSAGDEPGAVMELYDFAIASGFRVLALGKGKNNPLDYNIVPSAVAEQAKKSGLKPLRLASFIDGTNTMVEMAAMANATGFTPDVRGGHGPTTTVDLLAKAYSLKKDGGILNKYGIVDYAHGVAPGVFAIVTTDLPQVHHEMQFLKMGEGPNYALFRPYHLTSLETPISIAKAFIFNEPSIVPMYDKPVAEVITRAKRSLKVGESLDGIGETTIFGSIEEYNIAKEQNLVPIGLINKKAKVIKDIAKGEYITHDMLELDKSTEIYKMRLLQDE
jgi:predicted homoserine dehydrogenase-like protein